MVSSGVSQYYKKVKVVITVLDINDNSPQFSQPSIEVSMSENVPIGTTLALQAAKDNDTETFGIQGYDLSPSSGAFKVNKSSSEGVVSRTRTWLVFPIYSKFVCLCVMFTF